MMRVTMRQLQVFDAVARLKSYSRAADSLHVVQPTVSKQIKLLHETVGLPLLEQIGKKVYLTDTGRELHAVCGQWLDVWTRFEQTVADRKGMKSGRLRIAAVTTSKYFMPRILGPFCARYPGVDLSMEVVNRVRVLERMAQNQDDLYIMGVPPEASDFECTPFMDNLLVVIAPFNHPLAGQPNLRFSRVAQEPFIARERGSGTRIATERIFAQRKVQMRVRMELGSNEAIKQAVAGGLGLALLSKSTLNLDKGQKELAVLDVAGFPIRRSWYTVHPKGKRLSVVAATFLKFLLTNVHLLEPKHR
jgi:DNA-binding transcriptional LysR family regulator